MSNVRGLRLEDVVLHQIQTSPNRRLLAGMDSFRVPEGTPDAMVDLLRKMDAAEMANVQRSSNRDRHSGC
ncbi:hypothetical protein D5400_01805 [Georhizobium profundi]|jgi:predicted SnoaL-like aldol condensation-catalyzing enzyme|uniref:Uncharacterized protein n=1 Tax=Georhizobium profundi TaxID=2341112 RepID=A0A3S9AZN9_9HYPH|nr:hypothetical protein [Georhizobium profundi]AZN70178.1 hypothetical protein D5400_01805 [Georhizobium profundi]